MNHLENQLRVAIIDCGIDLLKLYNGERHGYEAHWVPLKELSFSAIENCDLVVIPTGSDGTSLTAAAACFRQFMIDGGWVLSLDGLADGLFDSVCWRHTLTDYKNQRFQTPESGNQSLLRNVDLEGLTTKDGVKGWWCEGELIGEGIAPLILDQQDRIVAGVVSLGHRGGRLIATAAARLPLFSAKPSLAPNVFFKNVLDNCLQEKNSRSMPLAKHHFYVHSGNFAQRSFLRSDEFGGEFVGVHWKNFDMAFARRAKSIWIPWESNVGEIADLLPLFEMAVRDGSMLVIEDLRDSWLPGVTWYPRPVDSNWWRENRKLDIHTKEELSSVFCGVDESVFRWHYHGVFDGPNSGLPLLINSEGKSVLSLYRQGDWAGQILISTLDATFEFGAGKIKETRDYIAAVLSYADASHSGLSRKTGSLQNAES